MATTPVNVNFFDREVNDCPYPAYQLLRDEAPVWKDPLTGMYVITRYDDIRAILLDTERFTQRRRQRREQHRQGDQARRSRGGEAAGRDRGARRAEMQKLYEEKGWVPAPSARRARRARSTCRSAGCSTSPSGPRAIKELDPTSRSSPTS